MENKITMKLYQIHPQSGFTTYFAIANTKEEAIEKFITYYIKLYPIHKIDDVKEFINLYCDIYEHDDCVSVDL